MRRALFPGSFDPFTCGHKDIVERGLQIFDHITIAIGQNGQKQGWLPAEERERALRTFYSAESRVSVERYDILTIDFARRCDARFLLRGVRSLNDYAYELQMADINRQLAPDIETVVLLADPKLSALSSSMVRELAHFGHDVREYLPEGLYYQL